MKLSAANKAFLPGMLFMLLASIFILRFGAILLVIMLIPSLFTYFIDHQPRKPMFKIVAACNLSAALPFIIPLIEYSIKRQYNEAGQMMEEFKVWAFIYCGAAAGWGMLYLSRYVARIITLMHYEYAISLLEKRQDLLVKEWGEGITPQNKR